MATETKTKKSLKKKVKQYGDSHKKSLPISMGDSLLVYNLSEKKKKVLKLILKAFSMDFKDNLAEEKEDLGLYLLMKEVNKEELVDREEIMKILDKD